MNFLLTLLAFTPLVFTGSVFFSYTSDKALFIRAIVSLVSVWFLIRLIHNEHFREKTLARLRLLSRNPVFLSVAAFFFFFVVSGIFAVDTFSAFFGTVERGEGVVGTLFFFGFFLFAALLFQKKEWLWFFKFTLLTSIILFIHAVTQVMAGIDRPYSLAGNSNFLSAYFLFPLLAAAIVFLDGRKQKSLFWRATAPVVAVTSFLGVFLANSRGVIVGMAIGVLSVLGYAAFSRDGGQKAVRAQKWSRVLLIGVVLLFGVFAMTKQSAVWQEIPALSRLVNVSLTADSTAGRLYHFKVALTAMDPAKNGLKRFFFGWGPENYFIVANTYYDPHQYSLYEYSLYDRVHNQVLDVFVASGLLGLLSSLAIWFFVFRFLFSGRLDFGSRSALLFFGIAYFIQNLFGFESLTTSIPFFAFLAFVIFLALPSHAPHDERT